MIYGQNVELFRIFEYCKRRGKLNMFNGHKDEVVNDTNNAYKNLYMRIGKIDRKFREEYLIIFVA